MSLRLTTKIRDWFIVQTLYSMRLSYLSNDITITFIAVLVHLVIILVTQRAETPNGGQNKAASFQTT